MLAAQSTATFATENVTVASASEIGNVMRLAIAQQCERSVLVVSVLNQQYARYMRPWAAMVSASRIAQKLSIWVVALDARTADAASRANVSHFDALSTRLHASVQNATAPPRTRNLPPNLGAWRFLAVWAGLAAGKRVLMSEADVLWDAKADFSAVMRSPHDYLGMMSGGPSVYNAGFFLARPISALYDAWLSAMDDRTFSFACINIVSTCWKFVFLLFTVFLFVLLPFLEFDLRDLRRCIIPACSGYNLLDANSDTSFPMCMQTLTPQNSNRYLTKSQN